MDPYIAIQDLEVRVSGPGGPTLIDSVSFELGPRQSLGVVGESGSGKTMLCRSLLGTLPRHRAMVRSGSIQIDGVEMAGASEREWRAVRGHKLGYVPQGSLAGLNPVLTIGAQLQEAVEIGSGFTGVEATQEVSRLLDLVQIPRARDVVNDRAVHLSGGMRQRVLIAAALALRPKAIILDEPTTALDVTVQRAILDLILEIRDATHVALLVVSHDLGVVNALCDSLLTMYAGSAVELGRLAAIRQRPRHPYTGALISARRGTSPDGSGTVVELPGTPPTVGEWPSGCRFSPRCQFVTDVCRSGDNPSLEEVSGSLTACLRAAEVT